MVDCSLQTGLPCPYSLKSQADMETNISRPFLQDVSINVSLFVGIYIRPHTPGNFRSMLWSSYSLPLPPPFVLLVPSWFTSEITQRVDAIVPTSEQAMEVYGSSSSVPMTIDDCRPRSLVAPIMRSIFLTTLRPVITAIRRQISSMCL